MNAKNSSTKYRSLLRDLNGPARKRQTRLEYVEGLLCEHGSKRGDNGNWQCPAHSDRNPSLSVGYGDGSTGVVIHCFAGCTRDDVLAELGTTWTIVRAFDIVEAPAPEDKPTGSGRPRRSDKGNTITELAEEHGGVVKRTAYVYRVPPGGPDEPIARKVFRFDFADGTKTIRQKITSEFRETPVLYKQARVENAIAAGKPVYVVEGEKSADGLNAHFRELEGPGGKLPAAATCSPGGAEGWTDGHGELLARAPKVVVIADYDEAGFKYARSVVESLLAIDDAADVSVVRSATNDPGDDICEHLAAKYKIHELRPVDLDAELAKLAAPEAMFTGASGNSAVEDENIARAKTMLADDDAVGRPGKHEAEDETTGEKPGDAGNKKAPTQADLLVEIGLERYRFGQSLEHRPFAVPKDGPNLAREIGARDKQLTAELARELRRRKGIVPGSTPLAAATNVLLGEALDAEPEPLALRVAQPEPGRIVIDLGDAEGRAIVATADGWKVVDRSPVLFRRTPASAAFPMPERGGDVAELKGLLNVDSETFDLLMGWCVSAYFPDIPHAVLYLNGEQGTAKSTATKMLVKLIDPSSALTRKGPRDEHEWHVAASASWVVALENISHIQVWESDAFCRAVTGDAAVVRELYSDDNVRVKSYRRVLLLNGIEVGGIRGDLSDRMFVADLERIPECSRKEEAEVWTAFDALWPRVFGALLDLLVGVLKVRRDGGDKLGSKPRMADFARVLRAVDLVRGSATLDTYRSGLASIQADLTENDVVTVALRELLRKQNRRVRHTAAELFDALQPPDGDRAFPKSARTLSQRLTLLAPALRALGWTVEQAKSQGVKRWTIALPDSQD